MSQPDNSNYVRRVVLPSGRAIEVVYFENQPAHTPAGRVHEVIDLHVCPDCGLRTRSWEVAYEKLRAMVEGTRLAEEALNRAHAPAG